ncbi:hypothetical protein CYMTET_3088 [Cymbomonas tetramitiformis]|uniref:Uncharacterized protein n=1 Tax=Cymbomonas tetramitiformis TaxID=36881 RepID=A0AAE0H5R4_9CHLO|nr:hypothetical protein CYMTET_3088 [Cymbomonas tetramitiformis]
MDYAEWKLAFQNGSDNERTEDPGRGVRTVKAHDMHWELVHTGTVFDDTKAIESLTNVTDQDRLRKIDLSWAKRAVAPKYRNNRLHEKYRNHIWIGFLLVRGSERVCQTAHYMTQHFYKNYYKACAAGTNSKGIAKMDWKRDNFPASLNRPRIDPRVYESQQKHTAKLAAAPVATVLPSAPKFASKSKLRALTQPVSARKPAPSAGTSKVVGADTTKAKSERRAKNAEGVDDSDAALALSPLLNSTRTVNTDTVDLKFFHHAIAQNKTIMSHPAFASLKGPPVPKIASVNIQLRGSATVDVDSVGSKMRELCLEMMETILDTKKCPTSKKAKALHASPVAPVKRKRADAAPAQAVVDDARSEPAQADSSIQVDALGALTEELRRVRESHLEHARMLKSTFDTLESMRVRDEEAKTAHAAEMRSVREFQDALMKGTLQGHTMYSFKPE